MRRRCSADAGHAAKTCALSLFKVSEMFATRAYFRAIRENVVRTASAIRPEILDCGCKHGEEAVILSGLYLFARKGLEDRTAL